MPDESLLGTDPQVAAAPPAASPLGSPRPPAAPSPATGTAVDVSSIVDNILNLDAILSADVRRAEGIATIYLRPDLEARFDSLEAELELLTDSTGKPYPLPESGLDAPRTAHAVALEIQHVIDEYAASAATVRFRQRPADEWDEFLARHKDSDGGTRPPEFWNELIAWAAVAPTMTVEQVAAMRKKLGAPPMTVLGNKAWNVNAQSGVSIPKSLLSSHVLKQGQRGTS